MPTPQNTVPNNPEQMPEQPVREISQTDHLNKKLLTSLFKRMDEEESSSKITDPDKKTEDDDEWKV